MWIVQQISESECWTTQPKQGRVKQRQTGEKAQNRSVILAERLERHGRGEGQDEMIRAHVEINHVMCLSVKMGVSNVFIISVNANTKCFWFSP